MKTQDKVSHVAMDCHRTFSQLTARDAENRVLFRRRLEHGERVKLRRELRRLPNNTPVIIEGTFGWGWMADELQACGLQPHLSSSRKVDSWRKARGMAKTNGLDADLLSELWLERPRWWEVWLAPQEVRDQREWLRYRMGLVRMQTMTKCRIHATLHRHGILNPYSDLFGSKGRVWLRALVETGVARPGATMAACASHTAGDTPPLGTAADRRQLPAATEGPCFPTVADTSPSQDAVDPSKLRTAACRTLQGHLCLLGQLRGQIAQATREFRRQMPGSPAARRWDTLPGIGRILAYTIQAEVGVIGRFANGKKLASYSLLAPMADESGEETDDTPVGRHVGHIGRHVLKWAFVEAAHSAVRKSPRLKAVFDRRTDGGKRDKNRGYIAVARQLCHIGYACQKKGVDYVEHLPPRPGERLTWPPAARGDSCPELGQPETPMVRLKSPRCRKMPGPRLRP